MTLEPHIPCCFRRYWLQLTCLWAFSLDLLWLSSSQASSNQWFFSSVHTSTYRWKPSWPQSPYLYLHKLWIHQDSSELQPPRHHLPNQLSAVSCSHWTKSLLGRVVVSIPRPFECSFHPMCSYSSGVLRSSIDRRICSRVRARDGSPSQCTQVSSRSPNRA